VVEAYGEAWTEPSSMVSNGPFRLEAHQPDHVMAFSRNPAYRGRFTGNVERAELVLLPSAEWPTISTLYEGDGLDVVDLVASEIDRVRQRYAGEYVPVPYLATTYVGFDVSRAPFADRRARRAFVLATDKETLANVIRRGSFSAATGGFVPPGMPGHSEGIGLPFDPDRARQLLAEAGYPSGRGFPTVEALTRKGSHRSETEYLQALWWEELGIEIAWKVAVWEAFGDRLDKAPPHIHINGWAADCPDPSSFLAVPGTHLRRFTHWRNEAYERLVEDARAAMDQGERVALYRQADRILVEEAAIVPLGYARNHLLVKPWVKRFPRSAMKSWFWKDVVIEPH
jgi:oligopeptide transport system substrate-binding protein